MTPTAPLPQPDERWAATLVCWAMLLAAGGLFAAATLAPKAKRLADLRAEYAANQMRLVAMERQATELERVADALEHDPRFAAELAKHDLSAARPGDERLAMPADLQLGAEPRSEPRAVPPRALVKVPTALLVPLATHAGLRAALLAIAASLTTAGLAGRRFGPARAVLTVVRRACGRYRAGPDGGSSAAGVRR